MTGTDSSANLSPSSGAVLDDEPYTVTMQHIQENPCTGTSGSVVLTAGTRASACGSVDVCSACVSRVCVMCHRSTIIDFTSLTGYIPNCVLTIAWLIVVLLFYVMTSYTIHLLITELKNVGDKGKGSKRIQHMPRIVVAVVSTTSGQLVSYTADGVRNDSPRM